MAKSSGNQRQKIMKRIYSFAFAAIAILSAASCQKELVNAPEADTNAAPFSFIAEREAETKTVLVEGKSTYWTPGDKVSAIDSEGKAVGFTSFDYPDISKELSATSKVAFFYSPSYSIPADLKIHAIYPNKTGEFGYTMVDGVINNLRIAGTQTAVAGSFDPAYAVAYAYGEVNEDLSIPTLTFKNIHSLVKFTIGGETAPKTVTLTNNGFQAIAGLFTYDPSKPDVTTSDMWSDDAKKINLIPAEGDSFKVGETYYIAFRAGCNLDNLTLSFDDKPVYVKSGTVEPAPLNKIFNIGVVEFPEESNDEDKPEYQPDFAECIWSYSSDSNPWWTGVLNNGEANMDRTAATDGEYVYIVKASTSGAGIYAINIEDPSVVKTVNTEGVTGGYFPTSCVRTIYDPTTNKHILIASAMGMNTGETVNIYAWENGIDAAPTVMCSTWTIPYWASRRFGDFFTVCGDWTKGELWFRSMTSCTVARYNIINGVLQKPGSPDGFGNLATDIVEMGSLYRYSMTSTHGLVVTPTVAKYIGLNDGIEVEFQRKDVTYNKCFGFAQFEINSKKYIAYTRMETAAKGKLVIIENAKDDLKAALEDNWVIFEQPIHNTDIELQLWSGNTMANCSAVEKDGQIYIIAHQQNVGLSVFKVK